jgi:hypothetical protein
MRKEVLLGAEGEKNILHTLKRRKNNWIGHIVAQGLTSKTEGRLTGLVTSWRRD